MYGEANKKERANFLEKIKLIAEERLVYVDEAGIDNTIDYPYGYCLEGERFAATKLGYRTERISMISGWCSPGGIVAPMVFEGYCNGNLFCQWLEEFLLPELLPDQIVIIDNASFHPESRIEKLVKQARCQVIFLPAYSPDLNKIEKFWARLKNLVSQIINDFDSLVNPVNQAFRELS